MYVHVFHDCIFTESDNNFIVIMYWCAIILYIVGDSIGIMAVSCLKEEQFHGAIMLEMIRF
jgi:hypothetical protein